MSTSRRAARSTSQRRPDSARQSGAAEIGAPLTVGEAAALLRLTSRRVQALAREGRIPGRRIGRRWLFRRVELERMVGATPGAPPREPALSARNRLRGQIRSLRTDGLMAEVVVSIGDQELVAIITRSSAEALRLRRGDDVEAVVKSTEVMIAKDMGR